MKIKKIKIKFKKINLKIYKKFKIKMIINHLKIKEIGIGLGHKFILIKNIRTNLIFFY
jgi:hypothetical protein